MEELENSAVQAPEQTVPGWYEGVSLEDAELYIHANLKSAARSVIAIGYYLKCVKAKELFAEAGFKDIYDYAKERFGFSTSTTNRYMSRNDKFSINGNSPILDEKYKDFNKSQLQEMLSLDSEQLEKVTPEMSVLQIREMKKPKEIPYVHMPGQVELTDFPGIEPEDVAAASKTREEASASRPEKPTYTISAEDLLPDPETQETKQSIAISQKEPEPEVIHFIAGTRTIDNAYGATVAAVVRVYLDSGYVKAEKECEVTAFGLVYKVLKRQDVTVFYSDTGQTVFDVENARLEEEYQYWHGTKAEPEPMKQTPAEPEQDSCPPGITDCRRQEWGTGPAEQEAGKKECKACWASWKRQHKALGAAAVEQKPAEAQQEPEEPQEPNPPETVIDGEFTEIQEPEKGIQEPEESLTELQIAQSELERAKRLLEKGLGCGVDENDIHIRWLKTAVCAWASYVCDLDSIVNPPPKPVQPELPVLKNNDQRAAFIDNYETWPLWIETAQTGERYYRYDLEDGTSMVVKVYQAKLFYSIEPGGHDFQYRDGYGQHEYYLLQPGKFFRDCDTNRSLLIEKLKEIQKVKKG